MGYERIKRGLKLRLLILVLVLALLWYTINPAPSPAPRPKRKPNEPPPKKRELEPAPAQPPTSLRFFRPYEPQTPDVEKSTIEDPDDFDWPEFIDG
jgi:hypothetical protein